MKYNKGKPELQNSGNKNHKHGTMNLKTGNKNYKTGNLSYKSGDKNYRTTVDTRIKILTDFLRMPKKIIVNIKFTVTYIFSNLFFIT